MDDRRSAQIGVLLAAIAFGCALGAGFGWMIARTMAVRSGRAALVEYARRLQQMGDRIAVENGQATAAVVGDHFGFCSDEELTFMREYVFRAPRIRDLGRTRDGKLYCTTGVGRLDPPVTTKPPDLVSGGAKLYRRVWLASDPTTSGIVAERNGVSIMFNGDLVKSFEEPPMHYLAVYFTDNLDQMMSLTDPPGHLAIAEIQAGAPFERDGVLYQPSCTAIRTRCVVAFESRRDMLASGRGRAWCMASGGGLLGAALALVFLAAYRGRRSMESQLRRALRRGALTLEYQPIVNLATGEIVAAEALVRWLDEDGTAVLPEVFVALAEERGFEREITRLVARRAAEELGGLLATGTLRLMINIGAGDLADEGFLEQLDESFAAADLAPERIVLELTERSIADQELAVAAVAKLKSRGYSVYVDDFGTGYSNLAYLHLLEVDGIKVDRAFTQTVGPELGTASVVPQILEMARQLELTVIVEGIETLEQAEYFRRAGLGILGQGWLFGKAVPAGELRAMVGLKGLGEEG